MRILIIALSSAISIVSGEFYSSFSSSSFSSSYSNVNGEEHSESAAEEHYSEQDSNGLNRRGSGQLLARDGNQVYEKTENCDGDKCDSRVDKGKRRLVPLRRNLRVDI